MGSTCIRVAKLNLGNLMNLFFIVAHGYARETKTNLVLKRGCLGCQDRLHGPQSTIMYLSPRLFKLLGSMSQRFIKYRYCKEINNFAH